MPKETVQGTSATYDLRVGWRAPAGGEVQVGIESVDGISLLTRLYGEPWQLEKFAAKAAELLAAEGPWVTNVQVAEVGRRLLDLLEGLGTDPSHQDTGYTSVWATLSRDGCNALIRAVRKARDRVFGADA
jgi:hypothetical protein